MAILAWIALGAVGTALALLLIALATPVRLGLTLCAGPTRRVVVSARLFGGLTPALPLYDSARPPKKKRRNKAPERRKRSGSAGGRRLFSAAGRLVGEALGVFRLTRLTIDADVGLSDPAETGALYGRIASVTYALPQRAAFRIDIRPDFERERLEGAATAEISFTPLAFLPPILRFVWRAYGPER